jgi:uncharacterized protein YqgV (UPF0045/DUF77 family)
MWKGETFLSIIPVGNGGQTKKLAEVLKVVDSFGLAYQVTCIEGEWSQIEKNWQQFSSLVKKLLGQVH